MKFIEIFIEAAKIPCLTIRLFHSSDRSYDPISYSTEASTRPRIVDGRNKLLFLRPLPNQSKLPSIHGLIQENTRSLSSLSSSVTITGGAYTRSCTELSLVDLFTGYSLFLMKRIIKERASIPALEFYF